MDLSSITGWIVQTTQRIDALLTKAEAIAAAVAPVVPGAAAVEAAAAGADAVDKNIEQAAEDAAKAAPAPFKAS